MNKPSFARALIKEHVERQMESVSALVNISEGEESQAFWFTGNGGARYVVRVNNSVSGFEKDRLVQGLFARPELPVPRVTYIGPIGEAFLCISEAAAGTTLESIDPQRLRHIVGPTSDVWEAIGRSDIAALNGVGCFDASGAGHWPSWREFLLDVVRDDHYDWPYIKAQLGFGEVEHWLCAFRSRVEVCPEIRRLVHGDFGSSNVLTDGRRITGVIDWSEALIGDPWYDVANVFFWRSWLPCMEAQAAYFEDRFGATESWTDRSLQTRLTCYQLRIGLGELYQSTVANKHRVQAWVVERCRELFDRAE